MLWPICLMCILSFSKNRLFFLANIWMNIIYDVDGVQGQRQSERWELNWHSETFFFLQKKVWIKVA